MVFFRKIVQLLIINLFAGSKQRMNLLLEALYLVLTYMLTTCRLVVDWQEWESLMQQHSIALSSKYYFVS